MPAKFDDFLQMANFFYSTIGMHLVERENVSRLKNIVAKLIFYSCVINLSYILILELIFVVLASGDGNEFIDVIMALAFIGFVIVGGFKIVFMWHKRDVLLNFLHQLKGIFPVTYKQQLNYNLSYYLRQCYRITVACSVINMITCWIYNLYPLMDFVISNKLLHTSNIKKYLPYAMYIPYNHTDHWSFYILYVSQDIAAYNATAGQILTDLLLSSCATQLIMHYDFLSKTLETYKSNQQDKLLNKQKSFEHDKEFIANMIQYHANLLELSQQMNNIVGVPILLNFIASSFIICFLSFQIAMGSSVDNLSRLFLFLTISIVQIYLICYYGQQLIDSSTNVAAAVYNLDWYTMDGRLKKLLILMAVRAQQPAQLEATSLIIISKGTMSQLMQISYQFFTLLRTMYAKN